MDFVHAIRTIEHIPSVMNLRGITKYYRIGLGLFVYSLINVNEMAKTYEESSTNWPNPTLRKEF